MESKDGDYSNQMDVQSALHPHGNEIRENNETYTALSEDRTQNILFYLFLSYLLLKTVHQGHPALMPRKEIKQLKAAHAKSKLNTKKGRPIIILLSY